MLSSSTEIDIFLPKILQILLKMEDSRPKSPEASSQNPEQVEESDQEASRINDERESSLQVTEDCKESESDNVVKEEVSESIKEKYPDDQDIATTDPAEGIEINLAIAQKHALEGLTTVVGIGVGMAHTGDKAFIKFQDPDDPEKSGIVMLNGYVRKILLIHL